MAHTTPSTYSLGQRQHGGAHMQISDTHKVTRHAAKRMAQRGVSRGFLSALMANADQETRVGGGAVALRVSQARAAQLNFDDRLHRYVVVEAADGAIITVLSLASGARGRRYRRR